MEVAEFTKVKGVKNIQFMPVGLNNMVFNMCKFFLIPVNMVIMFASLIIVMHLSMANTKTMSTAERDKFAESILSVSGGGTRTKAGCRVGNYSSSTSFGWQMPSSKM